MNWRTRLRYLAEILRVNYWLMPAVMIIIGIVLARLVLLFPHNGEVDVDAVRDLLDTIGTTSINLAGVTFSITIVALTLASQQFGPRTLRNFLADRINQYTLGTFVSTYAYCLALSGMHSAFALALPTAAVFATYILAFHCIIMFVIFIHHVASGIRGASILSNLHREAYSVITRLIPPKAERDSSLQTLPVDFAEAAQPVCIKTAGFIQAIDYNGLIEIGRKHDLIIEIKHRTGQFVERNSLIALVSGELDETTKDAIARFIAIGGMRTPEQDPQYLPERIAEMAVRSLSPSMNDPYTAAECVHWLHNLLLYVKENEGQVPWHLDDEEQLRVWSPKMTYADLHKATLDTIKDYCADNRMVSDIILQVERQLNAGARQLL